MRGGDLYSRFTPYKSAMSLEQQLEAVLFFKGEPVSRKRLSEFLQVGRQAVDEHLEKLKVNLRHRGVVLQEKDDEVALGTAPEFSHLIEKLQKEELNRELSKASLETLSIVLYRNGASRSLIDYIRGVNSSFILRALSVRGLIEKIPDPKDGRRYIYRPTFDLLSFLGVRSVSELPDYELVTRSIESASQNLQTEPK